MTRISVTSGHHGLTADLWRGDIQVGAEGPVPWGCWLLGPLAVLCEPERPFLPNVHEPGMASAH